jgi:hypothetical protein
MPFYVVLVLTACLGELEIVTISKVVSAVKCKLTKKLESGIGQSGLVMLIVIYDISPRYERTFVLFSQQTLWELPKCASL